MPENDDISLDSVLSGGQIKEVEVPTNTPPNTPPVTLPNGNEDTTPPNTPPVNNTPPADDSDDELTEDKFRSLVNTFTNDDDLSDEDKLVKEDLLKKFKGASFDVNGNIIDEEGNVKVNFDDLYKSINEDAPTLDAKGNEIDAEGNIVKTAYELATENTVVNKLAKETGYELLDEEGNPKIYTDNEEGFKELTNDISAERFKDFKEEFFNQNPVLSEVAKHLLSGNTLDTFQQATDYSAIDVTKISDAEKESYIRRSFEVKGMDAKQIETMVQLIKDSNSLTDQAAIAVPALDTYEKERVSNRDAEYQQTIEKQQQEIEAYWNKANNIITEGKLANITIPDSDREAFYDYISTAIDDKGNSKEATDRSKETLEQQLQYSYLRFKGFDLSKLVKQEVSKEKSLSLKERIKRSKSIKDSPLNDANVGVTSGEADITISKLLGKS